MVDSYFYYITYWYQKTGRGNEGPCRRCTKKPINIKKVYNNINNRLYYMVGGILYNKRRHFCISILAVN